jgi:hypothetical protein
MLANLVTISCGAIVTPVKTNRTGPGIAVAKSIV